jgi:squalene synthase HpnC
MRAVSVDHYENFPVASWLCPPRLRPAVVAIYRFARTADDLADEGDAPPAQRLQDLAAYRADLLVTAAGRQPSPRWKPVFDGLAPVLVAYRLPVDLLLDLLSAFEQDVVKQRYADRAELLDYCRRSANPVGRLVLHLHDIADAPALRQSDAICTALQLANFWQDFSVDMPRGRLYAPEADCLRAGVAPALPLSGGAPSRTLIDALVGWARELMGSGAPLVHRVPGRAGWELRLVVQGGLRILERVEALGDAVLHTRPTIGGRDAPRLLWRALAMRAAPPHAQRSTA